MLHLPVVLSHHTLTHIHRSVNPTEMGGTGLAHGASSWGSRLCEWVLFLELLFYLSALCTSKC